MSIFSKGDEGKKGALARSLGAYQAYYEHMPLRRQGGVLHDCQRGLRREAAQQLRLQH